MEKLKNASMVVQTQKEVAKVYTTTDYYKFKTIEGNRNKNLLHLKRLETSMKEKLLFTIIIVNEKFEIIDGQHRFDIISKLGYNLYYVICKGYGLNEVHILNQNSKTWNADDFMQGYCDLGYIDYLRYREFKLKYGIGHNECHALLTGKRHSPKLTVFFAGEFKIISYNKAVANIEKIFMVSPFYKGYRRRTFIYAMLGLFKNPNFEFTEFLQKLKIQPTAMVDCSTVEQYLSLIEEIYNYRRKIKINLRFSNVQ